MITVAKRLEVNPGDKYSRLTIIKEVEQRKHNARYFLCRCNCGNEKEISLIQLRTGKTKSCGCYRKEKLSKLYTTHGDSGKKLYMVWSTMKDRCLKPKSNRYKYYGARGIKVCSDWLEYEPFKDWAMANGYKEGLTIERMDVNGDYEPNNCTWIPQSEQTKNARSNVLVTINGETNILQYWVDYFNISRSTVYRRLKRGWSIENALKTPPWELPE